MSPDATPITPNLHIGGFPTVPAAVKKAGFDAIVLSAAELAVPAMFPELIVIVAPLDDASLTYDGAKMAEWAAHHTAKLISSGKKVLITCAQGRNRSGLITALTLKNLGMNGREAVVAVQARRQNALSNLSFVDYVANGKLGRIAG